MGVLFAQPAQLPLLRDELAVPVALRRDALFAQHQVAAAALAAEPAQARASAAAYREQLARCEFVVLRLQHVWSQPVRALRYTLLYCWLVLLPGLLARSGARGALRRYQLLHAHEQRLSIARSAAEAQASIGKLLTPYPTYHASGQGSHDQSSDWLATRAQGQKLGSGAEP
jgi:hypothetical protein